MAIPVTKGTHNLQDNFLNQIRKENMLSTIFLVNGYQIKGSVRSFDNFTILLDVDGKQQLVYKHAISTIVPFRNIAISMVPATATEQQEIA